MKGSVQADRRSGVARYLVRLVPELPNPVQHLTRDPVILHHGFPVPEPAQLPLDHEGPDPVGSLIQQCTAPILSVGSMRRGVEGTQCRKGPFNLAIQVPQCPRLLLTQLIVEHVAISGSGND